jgi:hypothetical protein
MEKEIDKAREAEARGDYFSAAFHYKSALLEARKFSDGKSIILLKKKLVETSKKSQEEFKSVEFETEIPKETLEIFLNQILSPSSLNEILFIVGMHPYFQPKVDNIKKTSEENMPLSYQLATLSTVTKEGHLVEDGEDGPTSWYFKMYQINQELISNLYLDPIFKRLNEAKRMNSVSLVEYLNEKGIFGEEDMFFIKQGIDRYFSNDYVSAAHILVPRFERVFLSISEKIGLDVVSLNRTKEISTQERTLSLSLLSSPEFQNVWGKDFCEQVSFVLLEPLGFKFRHKVAHGTITPDECNSKNVNLIIYLYLFLVAHVNGVA